MSSADETTHLLNGNGANDPLKYEAVTWSRVAAADRKEGHTSGDEENIKIYWWRWVVLAVFTSIIAVNNAIWITYGSIADVVTCYYGVSDFWVNSLVTVFMLTYLLLIFPALWLVNAVGLRATVVIAACCNAIGAGLRMAAVGRQYFWLLFTGQTVASITNLLLWGTPAYLSSVWFPPSQRCIATAIGGALGPQLGVMIGFLSPILVHSEDSNTVCSGNATLDQQYQWTKTIYSQLLYWMSGQTAVSLVIVILSLVAFPSVPPTPPSKSRQLLEGSPNTTQRWSALKTTLAVMKNGYFLLFMVSAGIRVAGNGAVPPILNELIHAFYPDRDTDVAYIGLTSQLCGLAAMFITGIVLDLTKTYYLLSVVTSFAALLSIGGFVAAIEFQSNFYILYPLVTIFSVSNTAYLAVAYEYASEMTYPLPEGTSGGLINLGSRPFSILMVVVGPMFMTLNGKEMPIGGWIIVLLTLFAAVLALFIHPELKKTNIDKKQKITTST